MSFTVIVCVPFYSLVLYLKAAEFQLLVWF